MPRVQREFGTVGPKMDGGLCFLHHVIREHHGITSSESEGEDSAPTSRRAILGGVLSQGQHRLSVDAGLPPVTFPTLRCGPNRGQQDGIVVAAVRGKRDGQCSEALQGDVDDIQVVGEDGEPVGLLEMLRRERETPQRQSSLA